MTGVKLKIRKKLRLEGYDYSQAGSYFITVCVKDRKELFGEIKNCVMELSELGSIANEFWKNLVNHFDGIELGEFIVMPNHIHGIIYIYDPVVDTDLRPLQDLPDRTKMLIPKIIHQYKSSFSRIINSQYPNLNFSWQRSYYDHIIRNEKSLENIIYYIKNNPLNWKNDIENCRGHACLSSTKDYYQKIFKP